MEDTAEIKKKKNWSSSAGSLGKKMEKKRKKEGEKIVLALFFKSQRFFKFIE